MQRYYLFLQLQEDSVFLLALSLSNLRLYTRDVCNNRMAENTCGQLIDFSYFFNYLWMNSCLK
jgi:hypothetical protein